MARKFRMTASGDRILTKEREASRAAVSGITAEWNDADRATFAKLLALFNLGTEALTGRTWPRP